MHMSVWPAGQPDLRTRWQDNYPRSAASTRRKACGSIATSMRTVVPPSGVISIRLAARVGVVWLKRSRREFDAGEARDRLAPSC
jgi:hypothetical protein